MVIIYNTPIVLLRWMFSSRPALNNSIYLAQAGSGFEHVSNIEAFAGNAGTHSLYQHETGDTDLWRGRRSSQCLSVPFLQHVLR